MKSFEIDQSVLEDGTYRLNDNIIYVSARYRKTVICRAGMTSDGATGAVDIVSRGWWIHDQLCNTGEFNDGTPCTVWQASQILQDILVEEGNYWRAKYWFWATVVFGGGECRANGWR